MSDLPEFDEHLRTLDDAAWNRLFDLLPEIEQIKTFGELKGGDKQENGSIQFPYWSSAPVVDRFFNLIIELDLAPPFDWVHWDEGKTILKDEQFDYTTLDVVTLCKLITTITRADRFNDGFMISCFENGIITKIIRGLQYRQNLK